MPAAAIVPNVKELLHGVVDGKTVMRQLATQRHKQIAETWRGCRAAQAGSGS